MIENVLKSVLTAEQKAEEIKTDANNKASEITSNAYKKAEQIALESETVIKKDRLTIIQNAEKQAEDEYAQAIKTANANVEALKREKQGQVESLAKEIARRIIDGSR